MSTLPATPPAHVPCPKCKQDVPYFDQPDSTFFACPMCHALFKAANNDEPATLVRLAGRQLLVCSPALWARCGGNSNILRHEETGIYTQLAVYRGHWVPPRPTGGAHKIPRQPTSCSANPQASSASFSRCLRCTIP